MAGSGSCTALEVEKAKEMTEKDKDQTVKVLFKGNGEITMEETQKAFWDTETSSQKFNDDSSILLKLEFYGPEKTPIIYQDPSKLIIKFPETSDLGIHLAKRKNLHR